jgi:alkanesulfonate monooxygenase SsuD/methylene tetrahydromethanopterin reductase-like flavin-dependent oxidoreductase (luciferase family)
MRGQDVGRAGTRSRPAPLRPVRPRTGGGGARRSRPGGPHGGGFASGWVSDHFSLPLSRYGLGEGETGGLECWTALTLAAVATTRLRVGSLVLAEGFRPPGVLAKMAATLDRLSAGRLDLGLGAGWHEAEYARAGLRFPPPGERLARLEESVTVVRGMLGGGPFSYAGRHHRADGARCVPPALGDVPVWIGGSGDRLLGVVARVADGWNVAWRITDERLRDRLAVLARACEAVGRDPATVRVSLGLYCVTGRTDADVRAALDRLAADLPPGRPAGAGDYAEGALVGPAAEVTDRLGRLADLGVEQVIVTPGPMAFRWPGDWWAESVAAALLSR